MRGLRYVLQGFHQVALNQVLSVFGVDNEVSKHMHMIEKHVN